MRAAARAIRAGAPTAAAAAEARVMRDIVVTLIVFGSIPFILYRPWIGVLMWSWIAYMNPHRLAWGFAHAFPFAAVVGLVTIVALLFSREKKRIPWSAPVIVLVLFICWFSIATIFALNPEGANAEWERTMKIQLFTFITLMLMNTQTRINWLVILIAFSIGFFGIKGGLFALATGGHYRVWGPDGTFIGGNNEIALALIMVMPLMRYLQLEWDNKRGRLMITGFMVLMALAILASHSRGALLAGTAMTLFLWLKSPNKGRMFLGILALLPVLVLFMPEEWFQRMETIETYDQDRSAMGRINAWWFAYHLALDRPLVGGGFDTFTQELFNVYAPDPTFLQDAHSIYFEVLGEQGFVGLGLYLLLGIVTIRTGQRVLRACRDRPDLKWCANLVAMVQVSILGYAVGGAFLGLAYFDLYYHLIAIIVLVDAYVRERLAQPQRTEVAVPAPSWQTGSSS
jgi:probable O-glycosylation ligase (exosortase A-associated)